MFLSLPKKIILQLCSTNECVGILQYKLLLLNTYLYREYKLIKCLFNDKRKIFCSANRAPAKKFCYFQFHQSYNLPPSSVNSAISIFLCARSAAKSRDHRT